MNNPAMRAIALISGRGSNLQAILQAQAGHAVGIDVCAVISNRCDAAGLQIANQANIPTRCIDHNQFNTRDSYDDALHAALKPYEPELIIMAGFMRILTSDFVSYYQGRILNIHPSLLPKYRGLNTHQRAIDNGEKEHGASVHFVTPELDGGPVIIQSRIPLLADDDANSLAQRVLKEEHKIYPIAIEWFASGRLYMRNNDAYLDEKPLYSPYNFSSNEIIQQLR